MIRVRAILLKKRLLEIILLNKMYERNNRRNITIIKSMNMPFRTHSSAKEVILEFTFTKYKPRITIIPNIIQEPKVSEFLLFTVRGRNCIAPLLTCIKFYESSIKTFSKTSLVDLKL
jgi:hypothetical protein